MNAIIRHRPLRHRTVLITLLVLLVCRIFLMFVAPLTDPSESRYAEISRKMVETRNWVTPQFDYGVPFWAKPPLSMWMSATGIEWFGATGFGARIFIFVSAGIVLWLVMHLGYREYGRTFGIAAAAMLMGMPLFFYCSAAAMTDMPLVLGTTLVMAGFWFCFRNGSKAWGYVAFLGLAVGLLAKGPLVAVISGPLVLLWLIVSGEWRKAWKTVPWIGGVLMMLAIAVPWYVLAEKRTPGFIDYFLIGEHWKRFTVPQWKGDLYGKAHEQARGAIWLIWLIVSFPWCIGLLAIPFGKWRKATAWCREENARGLYLLGWALWPLLFFTPSRNIIATYPLPALPAFALLLAEILRRFPEKRFHPFHPAIVGVAAVVTVWAIGISTRFQEDSPKTSEEPLLTLYHQQAAPGDRLVYYDCRRFSAQFYTNGRARNVDDPALLEEQMGRPSRLFVASLPRHFASLPAAVRARFLPIHSFGPANPTLYAEIPAARGIASNPPADSPAVRN